MISLLIRIAGGVVAAIVLAVGLAWVIGVGPFAPAPSPAARVQAKVEKAVPKVQGQAAAAVNQVEGQARTAIEANETRTERHVANIRAVELAPVPAGAARPLYRDFPDRQFYAGVCGQELYAGNPDCRGLGGEPEGRRAPARPGALRRR